MPYTHFTRDKRIALQAMGYAVASMLYRGHFRETSQQRIPGIGAEP
jgi:hypothetical protein